MDRDVLPWLLTPSSVTTRVGLYCRPNYVNEGQDIWLARPTGCGAIKLHVGLRKENRHSAELRDELLLIGGKRTAHSTMVQNYSFLNLTRDTHITAENRVAAKELTRLHLLTY